MFGSPFGRVITAIVCLALVGWAAVAGPVGAQDATPDDHMAHHSTATPASSACNQIAASTPAAVTPRGTPMGSMDMAHDFDLVFIDMMVVHHEGALAMARVAAERGEHQEVRDLAAAILAGQQAEVDQLRAWRDAWYPGAPAMPMDQMGSMMGDMMAGMVGTPGAGMGDMGDMMGMGTMDPRAEVDALCAAPGSFDQAFLEAMIPHHQSAVAMAQMALQRATHSELTAMAQGIVDAQTAEIAQMQAWLAAWYGATPAASPQAQGGTRVAVTQGELYIEADRTEFRVGDAYVFLVTNEGAIAHDFAIEPRGTDHAHATGHKAAANALIGLETGETRELTWTFEEPGDFELVCRLPAHYEAGMLLEITVVA